MENQNNPAAATPEEAPKKKLNIRFVIVFAVLIIGGGSFGISKYVHAQHHEETDDAQVEANISPVIPRVGGYINEVKVVDNQRVKKGDTLIVLDDRDLKLKVDLAQAALLAAQSNMGVAEATTTVSQANISTNQANVLTVDAQIEAAKVNVWRANQDFTRYSNLIKDHSITQQQFEQAQAAKETADRQLQILVEQRNAANRQTSAATSQSAATSKQISVANATIQQRQADLDNAKLNLSYAVIVAPEDGLVSKVGVQPGQFVSPGQSLFSVVLDNATWVVANFKETQLDKMKIGQEVSVEIDAFPSHEFKGKVASFSPATGSRFSLLPADNASGNFVKVVQRLPVKVVFDNQDSVVKMLRPGMNANVDVHIN